jgi:predicted nucleotidyltransferase
MTSISNDPLADLYRQLAQLAAKYGAEKLVLFGSRARGDARYNSDVDLAIYGMPEANQGSFYWEADELPTLLKFDLVHIRPGMDPVFLANIEKDGVILYGEDK